MSKGGKKETVQTPDWASQQYINQMRAQGQQGAAVALDPNQSFFTGPMTQTPGEMAQAFMNPYQQNVIDGVRGEFDHLRNQAGMQAGQQATQAGAFGGSRHGVMEGARLGELDRAQASQIGGLLYGGHQNAMQQGLGFAEHQRQLQEQQMQEPLFRQQQAQNFMNLGLGPTGTQTTEKTSGGGLMGLLGAGASIYGAYQGSRQ